MNKEDVITLEDNHEYLILDIAELEDAKYLYSVEIDEKDIPTTNYKFFQVYETEEGNKVDEVTDKEKLETLANIFTINYLNESTN